MILDPFNQSNQSLNEDDLIGDEIVDIDEIVEINQKSSEFNPDFDWSQVTLTYGDMEVDDFDLHVDNSDAAFTMFDEDVGQLECEGCLECDECKQYLISIK